jgi:hypothetical protein
MTPSSRGSSAFAKSPIGVATYSGRTALTRIPRRAFSSAVGRAGISILFLFKKMVWFLQGVVDNSLDALLVGDVDVDVGRNVLGIRSILFTSYSSFPRTFFVAVGKDDTACASFGEGKANVFPESARCLNTGQWVWTPFWNGKGLAPVMRAMPDVFFEAMSVLMVLV